MTRPFRRRAPRAALLVLVALVVVALLAGPLATAFRAGGRELAADVVLGARWTLLASAGVVSIALPLALVLGGLAGLAAWPDALLARLVELGGALPTVVLVAVVRSIESTPGPASLILVLGAVRGVQMARLFRGEMLRVSGQDFVQAARALGLPLRAVVGRHVLPHALTPVLVSAAFSAAAVVALESALSFLGLGLPNGSASWGVLLGRVTGLSAIGPAAGILALTGALYVLADALDESLSAKRASGRLLRPSG